MSTFYIVRHAEKLKGNFYNPHLRHQDEPITLSGQQSSQKLWSFFSKRNISAIYISEYLRAAQTIEYVAGQLEISPVIDKRLNEIDNGVIEGMSDDEVRTTYPEVWNGFRERNHDFRIPERGDWRRTTIENRRISRRKTKLAFLRKHYLHLPRGLDPFNGMSHHGTPSVCQMEFLC